MKRQKKDVSLVLLLYEVPQLPICLIRKAHDILAGIFDLFLLAYCLKFCGFHTTKNKQKRFFKPLNFRLQKYNKIFNHKKNERKIKKKQRKIKIKRFFLFH